MGRPKKQTVDYFPHFVTGSRRTISILESKWGNDGYAFWFKLLELLCNTDGHSFNCSTIANQEYLYSYTKTEANKTEEIISMLVDLENIDRELWEKHRIIWCQPLIDNLKDVYVKRTTPIPKKPFSEEKIPEKPPEKDKKEENAPKTPPKIEKKPKSTPNAEISALFESLWKLYPVKKGKGQISDTAKKKLFSIGKEEMERAIDRYLQELKKDSEWRKPQNGSTFFNSGYIDYLDANFTPQDTTQGNGGVNSYGRNETATGINGAATAGGFKPSGGFKKQ